MRILKVILLSLLSFLLFLSLSLFGVAFTLKSTVLNATFMTREINKLDIPVAVKEVVDQQIQFPPEYQAFKEPMYRILATQEQWIEEQVDSAIKVIYDFLLSKTNGMSLTVQLDPLKTSIKNDVKQAFLKQIPPQLTSLSPAMVDQYFEQMWVQFAGQIPSRIVLDESQIPADTMAQLVTIKQWISYFQVSYNLLIIFMIILVTGIILLQHDVRAITRGLGVTFITFGAFGYAEALLSRKLAPQGLSALMGTQLPPSLQVWLSQLAVDFVKPLEMLCLGFLIGGVILVVVSFVYPKKAEEETA